MVKCWWRQTAVNTVTDITSYQPSERIAILRKRAIDGPPADFDWLRTYFFMEAWMAADSDPLPMRTTAGIANVIENMPVLMAPGEVFVGEHGNHWRLVNLWGIPDDFSAKIDESDLSDERKTRLKEWVSHEQFRWHSLASVAPYPDELRVACERRAVVIWGVQLNHSIRDYAKVLRLGFSGIRQEIQAALDALLPTEPEAPHRRANLLAWRRLCDAAIGLGLRHAEHARRMAQACEDPNERREWLEIAEVCDRVPANPARTFREALQSLWFAHMITVWEDGLNANGIGRADQFLWPYLERELADGTLTRDQACELLAGLWVKLYQSYDVQQMMIGGQKPDGSDATNDLSYMILDVTEGMEFVRCLSARLHKGSPERLVSRCVDLIARGGGIPFFFNDDAIIPALVSNGIAIEDARDYAAIGCIEITIPGKANPHACSNWVNLAKCVELAINDGKDLIDGSQVGPKTGTLTDHKTMDDVLAAFHKQLNYFMEWAAYGSNNEELRNRHRMRLPYLSILTEDCISRGLDIVEAGARYDYHSSAATGIPNAADALTALQIAVFDESRVTPDELLEALRTNFDGHQDLLQYLRHKLPKYGNDEPVPDGCASRLAQEYCQNLNKLRTASGGRFLAHLFTYTLMLELGKFTGASPEGRKAGEPLAYSVSPVQGRDKEGLTAVISSLSRLPHYLVAGSSSAIIEADPAMLQGPGRRAFVDLLITAIREGVGQLQFNVVDADTLRAAQDDPDRYRSLCVRVSGFSQQFCLLDRDMQDHIIARTKHKT